MSESTEIDAPRCCAGAGGSGDCPHCGDWHTDDLSCCPIIPSSESTEKDAASRAPAPGTVATVTIGKREPQVALYDGKFWRTCDAYGPIKCVPSAITSIETPYIFSPKWARMSDPTYEKRIEEGRVSPPELPVRPRHLRPHAEFGDDPSGWCGCAGCDPRPEICGCFECQHPDET